MSEIVLASDDCRDEVARVTFPDGSVDVYLVQVAPLLALGDKVPDLKRIGNQGIPWAEGTAATKATIEWLKRRDKELSARMRHTGVAQIEVSCVVEAPSGDMIVYEQEEGGELEDVVDAEIVEEPRPMDYPAPFLNHIQKATQPR